MRTQLAAYREEICRLHHANDTLAESNRILLDAVTTMKMEHAAGMQRLRGEMAPGFSWPDPDQSALVERYKTRVGELEAEVRALKRRYEHQNLSGKTEYTRSKCSRHLGVFCHLPAVDPVTSQGNDPKRSDAPAISGYVITRN